MADLTPEQRRAGLGMTEAEFDIATARDLAEAGVPIFVAYPDPKAPTGFRLPKGWQTTKPNPRLVDAWLPGRAVCAVMGHVLDLVDLDPRNGYQQGSLDGLMPEHHWTAVTPSEGVHYFVPSMGVGSRDNVLAGVDVKAGVNGDGHGFAFIAPTVRASKVTGKMRKYGWVHAPTLEELKAAADDRSGGKLAEMVRQARGAAKTETDAGDPLKPSPWGDLAATIAGNTRHDAVHKLASALRGRGGWRANDAIGYMRAVVFPLLDQNRGGHPYTDDEMVADITDVFDRYDDGAEARGETAPTVIRPDPSETVTLEDCHKAFRRWLGDEYDLAVLDVMLCALAVERLDGDPLWLLIISGPGAAKTETAQAAGGAGALVESTITGEAALLSGTPKHERSKKATGGLLRRLGDSGVLVVKDVTSIISMSRDRRAEVLAALREVHDGYWSRSIGSEGGLTLTWQGRIVVIGAVTTAWDTAHSVISAMGDRFVSVRLDSGAGAGRKSAGRRTAANTGDEVAMRAEMAAAVGGVVASVDANADLTLTGAEVDRLLAAADLVTLARTGVEYDYKGDVIDAHAPEMPTRFLRQLQQIIRGGIALGMDRAQVLDLAIRCARDSMPPVRLAIVDDLAENPHSRAGDIRRRVELPWRTVDRQCQALYMLGVISCEEVNVGNTTHWYYSLADGIDPNALRPSPDFATPPPTPPSSRAAEDGRGGTPKPTPANSGDASLQVSALDAALAAVPDASVCDCGHPLDQHAAPGCDVPVVHRPPDLWSTP